MGILSRLTTLMKANIHHRIDKMNNPEKMIQQILREVTLDLRTVQSEVHALEADIKRAKRAVDECEAEIRKIQRYKERAKSHHDEEKVMTFAREEDSLQIKRAELIEKYNQLVIDGKQLKLLEEKLRLDVRELESRTHTIREKAARLKQQQKIHHSSPYSSGFASYEEELNFKLEEAEALAKLREQSNRIDSIDEEIAKLDRKD